MEGLRVRDSVTTCDTMVSNVDIYHYTADRLRSTHQSEFVSDARASSLSDDAWFVALGSNALVTYDVRLGYKTDEMYDNANSEWQLAVQSRESRSIHCQPLYHRGIDKQVSIFACVPTRFNRSLLSSRTNQMDTPVKHWHSSNCPP